MEEDKGEASSPSQLILHEFQEDRLLALHPQHPEQDQHQQPLQPQPAPPPPHTAMQYNLTGGGYGGSGSAAGAGCEGFVFPSEPAVSVLPWSFPLQAHPFNPAHTITAANSSINNMIRDHNPFVGSSLPTAHPPPLPPTYGDFYARRASAASLQFGYDGGVQLCSDPLGLAGLYVGGPEALIRGGGIGAGLSMGGAASPFAGLGSEFGKMSAQEMMDAKALAASKSHSEAERRRRERINAHLAKLRSLLPSTTKTDKASLLAEVIQHVKELKRQTSEIAEESPVPSESDELTVDAGSDEEGRFVVRASLCCDDRTDLLPDLIKALKSLKLRTLKAEITTLGGRVRNVLVITGDDEDDGESSSAAGGCSDHPACPQPSIASIQEALKAVMERTSAAEDSSVATGGGGGGSAGGIKRQRTTSLASILEHRSI
uniref:Transcription factor AIG1 n=1 Tax=Anthurium amnicola TaxID=1678845 RepID=A0A1D1YUG4_9ARAE